MSFRRALCIAASFSCLLPIIGAAAPPGVTFEERLRAQAAIERIYFSHLEGACRTFDEVVTPEVIERKVRTSLRQSAALGEIWGTPVTGAMLRAETNRITRDTRFPERLREIKAALGDDPVLFQETFVRGILVERLSRAFFAFDQRFHAGERAEVDLIHEQLTDGLLDPATAHPRRSMTRSEPEPPGTDVQTDSTAAPHRRESPQDTTFDESLAEVFLPGQTPPPVLPVIGSVEENAGSFSIEVHLPPDAQGNRVATYIVPKIPWEEWWAQRQEDFDEVETATVAEWSDGDDAVAEAAQCLPDDTWDNGALDDMPNPRYKHLSVWTGTEMIILGGTPGPTNAARYDPLTDTWREIAMRDAVVPFAGFFDKATAVWTGSEIIVWGFDPYNPPNARYDPVLDRWSPISLIDAPQPAQVNHTAVWTGEEMIVWGGSGVSGGIAGRYNPVTDTWLSMSTEGAPTGRRQHTAVWTGSEMIVWGGAAADVLGTGARYNPATDSWASVNTAGAPLPRFEHTAIWTGHEMIIWGGTNRAFPLFDFLTRSMSTGGRYNPATDSWTPTASAGVQARSAHSAIWTGSRMIVWGGFFRGSSVNSDTPGSGALYDPNTNTWQPATSVNAPLSAGWHSAIWTGTRMIVWGGIRNDDVRFAPQPIRGSGGRYDPATNSWTPTTTAQSGLQLKGTERIVWTGNEMLAWAGGGGRYDPLTDSWRAITPIGEPMARQQHVAVWTGDAMFVWGGFYEIVEGGGLYDPVLDLWRPTSLVNEPRMRINATAVWSGEEVIVWGGFGFGTAQIDQYGGRYNPATDTWRLMPRDLNSAASEGHSAIWTGREMIVTGGVPDYFPYINTASYDPALDAWTPLEPVPVLAGRFGQTAVWTGSEVIVYGAREEYFGNVFGMVAWSYNPASNQWSLLAEYPLGDGRWGHAAVWTGRSMLVWGNHYHSEGPIYDSGLAYDRVENSWTPLSGVGQPLPRGVPQAIWTGTFMLVWGGTPDGRTPLASGGRYVFGQGTDDDGDGLSECAGDCDDSDSTVSPVADESCNGRDDDCDQAIDEGNGALCSDDSTCTDDRCEGAAGCVHEPLAEGMACEDAGSECTLQDTCDGEGSCRDSGFVPAGTSCGDAVSTSCTAPDTCDGLGSCSGNHVPDGTSCSRHHGDDDDDGHGDHDDDDGGHGDNDDDDGGHHGDDDDRGDDDDDGHDHDDDDGGRYGGHGNLMGGTAESTCHDDHDDGDDDCSVCVDGLCVALQMGDNDAPDVSGFDSLRLTVTPSGLLLSWEPPPAASAGAVTGYRIWHRDPMTCPWRLLAVTGGNEYLLPTSEDADGLFQITPILR